MRARVEQELPTEDLLDSFLIDSFPKTHRQLTSGMTRDQRVNNLLISEDAENIEQRLDEWIARRRLKQETPAQKRQRAVPSSVGMSPRDSLVQGVRTRAESIRSFLAHYLGTKDQPVPFGGRDGELAALDAWLAQAEPSCLLLTAPVGRGKSALLIGWALRLAKRSDVDVAYYPISIRFGTQLASDILRALCERLAFLQGEGEAQDSFGLTDQEQRDLFIQRLRLPVRSGRQLVVVIDGLDEATGLELNASLFPTPPPGLRIVVAAREGTGGRSEQDYCYALGWDDGRVHTQHLDLLQRVEDVASILDSAGLLTDALSNRQRGQVLSELLRLGAGEPFLIRELIRELQQKSVPTSEFVAYLQQCEPGFPALMDRWWKEQKKSLSKDTLDEYRALLDVLCAAYGALHRSDLQELLPDVFSESRRLDDGLAALGRFIVETEGPAGRGYVFSHPKLRDYFWGQLSRREQDALDARFVRYGNQTLDRIAGGSSKPGQIPRYVLHHLGAHLARSEQDLDRQMALVSKPWYDAWVATGSEVGFLSDVLRGLDAAAALNQQAGERDAPAPHLLHELRCALVANTMRSRAGSLIAQLLGALVARGKWSAAQALAHLCQADVGDQASTLGKYVVESFIALIPYLTRDLLRKATDFALLFLKRKHEDPEPLETLIPRLLEVDPEYFKIVLSTLPAWARARFHRAAVRRGQAEARTFHLDEAESACDELYEYPGAQVWNYRELVESAPERQEQLLPKLVGAAGRLPGLAVRFANLAQTYESWPTAEVVNALQDTIVLLPSSGLSESDIEHILFDSHRLPDPMGEDILLALGNEADAPAALLRMYQGGNFSDEHRARLLRGASKWPDASRQRLLTLVLDEIATCLWPHGLNRLVAVVLSLGTDEDKAAALERVSQLRKESTRAYGRALLAAVLPACDRLAALRAALTFLEPEEWQRECFNSLIPLLTEGEFAVAVMVLLSAAHPLLRRHYALHLANAEGVAEEARAALRALAQQAEEAVREEPPEWRRRIEEALALFSVDSLRARKALASAVAYADQSEAPWSVCSMLQTVLSGAPGGAAKRAAWVHLRRYYESGSVRLMEHSLRSVLADLPADLHAECVKVAVAAARSQHDVSALLWLRAYVREAEADGLLDEALACARGLDDEYAQLRLCIALADSIEDQRAVLGLIRARIKLPGSRLDLLLVHLRPRVVSALLPEVLDAAVVEIDSLPQESPKRISWTAGVLDNLDPDKRTHLIASVWEMMARFLARHRATMSAPGEGIYPNGTPRSQGDEISALVHDGPRLAKHLNEEQLREMLAGLPTRSSFAWSRVTLADALPEPDRTAQLRIELNRAAGFDPDDSMRITALALVAAHLPAGPEREGAIRTVLDEIERAPNLGDRDQTRVHNLWHLAGVLNEEHADRIFTLLNAAAASVGAVTSFPPLLAAMPESLRLDLGERLFSSSSSLSQDLQERLRAHLVGSVSSSQIELSLQAAIHRPEQSVLKALGSVGPRLSDQQLTQLTEALSKLQAQQQGGPELLAVLNSLILVQKQRGLSWRPAAYEVLRTTLHQRHRHRADMLHALAAQGPTLLALLKASCLGPASAIALVLEVGSTWP